MPELTPLDDNRQEHFLNGEDLEPITRREHFYAGRESELPAGHQEPETREEWFIQKYRGGGGDVTVVPLSVTENGTYSEEGKAYSPVSVNVPLPTNAYLLKSVNTPTPIASFNDGEDMVMPSLKVAIEPQQEGSGEPSPTNIRPISGWDEAVVNVTGINIWDEEWELGYFDANGNIVASNSAFHSKNFISVKPNTAYYFKAPNGTNHRICYYDANKTFVERSELLYPNVAFTIPNYCSYIKFHNDGTTYNNDISINYPSTDTEYHAYNGQTYTIDLDGTRYGGEVDVVNGVMTVDRAYVDLGSLTWTYVSAQTRFYTPFSCKGSKDNMTVGNIICSSFMSDTYNNVVGGVNDSAIAIPQNGDILTVHDSRYTDAQAFKQAMSGVQLVYELATPLTIQLSPTAVKSLLGSNNVWADTGDITDAEYFSKEV